MKDQSSSTPLMGRAWRLIQFALLVFSFILQLLFFALLAARFVFRYDDLVPPICWSYLSHCSAIEAVALFITAYATFLIVLGPAVAIYGAYRKARWPRSSELLIVATIAGVLSLASSLYSLIWGLPAWVIEEGSDPRSATVIALLLLFLVSDRALQLTASVVGLSLKYLSGRR
jgi:hypothetical protein